MTSDKIISGRALHFVFKVADRTLTSKFYREVLNMNVLRHEEFAEGCDAACNGPYNDRWSKTMVGYGSEDTHFAIELTYNYGITSYEKGNDFLGIMIQSKEAIQRAQKAGWTVVKESGLHVVEAPGGYKYYLVSEPQPTNEDPVKKVILASSNIANTVSYWNGILNMKIYGQNSTSVILGFADNQTKLEFRNIGCPVNHAKAYGRIAFSCPFAQQSIIEERIKKFKNKILTPLVVLDTPGKPSVRVIILADPDDHEICFVEDEGFRKLCKPDTDAAELLDKCIAREAKKMK